MSNANCGPINVCLDADWRPHAVRIPLGWTVLGTVTRKHNNTGALVRSPQGELFSMRGMSLDKLTQRRAEAALLNAKARAAETRTELDATA
jgi:hypothetical protein